MTAGMAVRLTPKGRGAVACIELAGDLPRVLQQGVPLFHPRGSQTLAETPIQGIRFGKWGVAKNPDAGQSAIAAEDVVVFRCGENRWEIHAHGGEAAVTRILQDLAAAGLEIHEPGGKPAESGSLEDECLAALKAAVTIRTAAILLEQCSGILPHAFRELQETTDRDSLREKVTRLLQWAKFGTHLTEPWKVVILGQPNVGKSSLINALLGFERAIVFDQPGTTRDVLTAETAIDGWPVKLIDTAGLRDATDPLEAAGIDKAREQILLADLRIVVLDGSQPLTPTDRDLLKNWHDALVVVHKADLPCGWADTDFAEQFLGTIWKTSSVTKIGIRELMEQIVEKLVPEIPRPGTAIPISKRQVDGLSRISSALLQHEVADGAVQQLLSELMCEPPRGA